MEEKICGLDWKVTYRVPPITGSPSLWKVLRISCHPSSMMINFGEQPPFEKLFDKRQNRYCHGYLQKLPAIYQKMYLVKIVVCMCSIPFKALFYSLRTHFSVKSIPSAPSKPVKMCRDPLVFKMTESPFVFLQYPMSL